MPNILILSAGRRVELVQLFQQAISARQSTRKVIAADAQEFAPAIYFADDAVVLPRVDDPHYVEELCRAIDQHDVKMVVPTIDTELVVLARHRDTIRERTGAMVLVADPRVVDITADKLLTWHHFVTHGLSAPGVYPDPTLLDTDHLPIVVKPRAGSSSIGVHAVHTLAELEFHAGRTVEPMFQELITGDEYTVDCFNDLSGAPVTIVPRLRIATRGGEILQGRITRDQQIIDAVQHLLATLPVPGPCTIQCFKTDHGPQFIEVNARFGGGAPMSIRAGADSCTNILRMLDGEELTYREQYDDGATFLRYDQSLQVDLRRVGDQRQPRRVEPSGQHDHVDTGAPDDDPGMVHHPDIGRDNQADTTKRNRPRSSGHHENSPAHQYR